MSNITYNDRLIYRDHGSSNSMSNGRVNVPMAVDTRLSGAIAGLAPLVDKMIKAQTSLNALKFKNELIDRSAQALQNHQEDPEGYINEYEGLINGIINSLPGDKYGRELLKESELIKQSGLRTIANTKIKRQQGEAAVAIRSTCDSITKMINPIIAGGIETPEQVNGVTDALYGNFQQAIGALNAKAGGDKRLLTDEEIANFTKGYNDNVSFGILDALLNEIQTTDELDSLIEMLDGKGIKIPEFNTLDSMGNVVGVMTKSGRLSFNDPRIGDELRSRVMDASDRILREQTLNFQLARLSTGPADVCNVGTTQEAADIYFDQVKGAFISGGRRDKESVAADIAGKCDILPTQVRTAIVNAVKGADPETMELAKTFLNVWLSKNPEALGRAFESDEGTLANAFQMTDLVVGQADAKAVREMRMDQVRARTGDKFDEEDYIESLVSKHCSDSTLTSKLNEIANEGKDRGGGFAEYVATGLDDLGIRGVEPNNDFSLGLMNELRDSYRTYLRATGGDIRAADKCLRTKLSQYKRSKFMSGVSEYAPERYAFVNENADKIRARLSEIGEQYLGYMRDDGEVSEGAKVEGVELVPTESTPEEDRILRDQQARGGKNFVTYGKGKRVYSPSYYMVLHYKDGIFNFGGSARIIGLFNPSEVIK